MKTIQPQKSRKQAYTAPMHTKSKSIAAHLSERLRKELGTRSVSLRKGDTVKVMTGFFKNKEGKITKVDRNTKKVYIEKIIKKKSDGTEFEVAIDPSNLMIRDLEKSDKKRLKNFKSVKK
jgi:large subunit ribosomal protein L24